VKKICFLSLPVFVLLSGFVGIGRHRPDTCSLTIHLNPVFNGQALQLSDKAYTDENGDTLYIDAFRFYLSNVSLKNGVNTTYKENRSYHLVDAEDSASQIIHLRTVAAGAYTEICFQIGVDSIANISGALDGDLDPIKGMYWAWNTGYINAKLMGHAVVCKTLHNAFEFHIGGYMQPYATTRTVVLHIPTGMLKQETENNIQLNLDVEKWFTGIDLSKTNSVLIPCRQAMQIADNYKGMFRIAN
jgi:hypothetical protein